MNSSENKYDLLSRSDWELIAKLSDRIHYTNSNESFLNHLYVVLNDALPKSVFVAESYSLSPISFEQTAGTPLTDEQYSIYKAHLHEHPVIQYFQRFGFDDVFILLMMSTVDEFHRTALYEKFYRQLGIEDQLIFAVPHPNGVYVIAYSRDTSFSEREQLMMKLLKPQLHIALQNWQRIRELELHLRTLEDKGASREGKAAQVHNVNGLIDRLTPRQRSVAELVAQGLENRQIAEELHISPKTVGKHLENIFEALNIHHRAALAAMWQQSVR